MKIRGLLIILLVVLCISFVTEFWLSIDEHRRIWEACDRSPGFSCDAVPQHTVGLLHMFSFALLGAVVVRQYGFALVVAVGYLALDIFGTYQRLGTGFFGGDMCPEGHPCWAAIRRATWFDRTALIILAVSIILLLWKVLTTAKREIAHEALKVPHEGQKVGDEA